MCSSNSHRSPLENVGGTSLTWSCSRRMERVNRDWNIDFLGMLQLRQPTGKFSCTDWQIVLSEGWEEAWQPSCKVTRSVWWLKTGLEDFHVRLGLAKECDAFNCWLGDRKGIQRVKIGCWFVGGGDLTRVLHVLLLQLSPPPPSSLAPIKSRMKTFWYRLTRVHLDNGR